MAKNFNNKTMALPRYYIPRDLEYAIKHCETLDEGVDWRNRFVQVLKKLKDVDCLEIAECHYLQFLKLGLYLEEYQKTEDSIRQFQIKEATIENVPDSKEKFKIEVEHLDETSNPFLNVSDSLIAYEPNIKRKTVYFLTVVKVCKGHVIVAANKQFCKIYSKLKKYNVEQKFNTYWLHCCHYALTAVNSFMISHYIFPKKNPVISSGLNYQQTWFNGDVRNNPNQNQAVCNIINKSSFPAPYILYGPPGTGKTSTLVEAICQSWRLSDDYILICAPSNAACDVVTLRLLRYIPSDNLYRMYSRTEEYSRINEDIKKCCNFKDIRRIDEIEEVDFSSKKIIITTLCTSLRLEKSKLLFSHLFIDEGGQATLADMFLPLCAWKSSRPFQIVISGDHQQLGPCIRSKHANKILGQSILEKLMKHEPYKKDVKTGYDPRYITKLIRNYRSSEEIIHVSNVLFYDNELIACRNKLHFFPVSFFAVEGREERSGSKSPYNEDEVNKVLFFTKKVVGNVLEDKIIREEDVGIVTPFRLQVAKIREKLDDNGLKEVDVGTVETFQGQEKKVIIISTVRSKTFVHDGVEHLGFLSNPKRFNVALTRAKALLVVVGNPKILQTDKYWRYFLKFCQENNSYDGDPLSFEISSSSLQDLTVGTRTKKSMDLFHQRFRILKLDDGKLPTAKINLQDASLTTTDIPSSPMSNASSITNVPVPINNVTAPSNSTESVTRIIEIVNSMDKPINNINDLPRSVVLPSSNQIPSMSTSSTGSINSVRNSSLSSDQSIKRAKLLRQKRIEKPVSDINAVPKSNVQLPSSINSSTKIHNSIRSSAITNSGITSNSVRNYSLNAGNLHTVKNHNVNPIRTNNSEIRCRKPVKHENNEDCGCCVIL